MDYRCIALSITDYTLIMYLNLHQVHSAFDSTVLIPPYDTAALRLQLVLRRMWRCSSCWYISTAFQLGRPT